MSTLRDKFKDAIRRNFKDMLPPGDRRNVTGYVMADNGDGTFIVQISDGNTVIVEPIYPIAVGQFVMVIRNEKGRDKAVPFVPNTVTNKIIPQTYFSGGLTTIFTAVHGTNAISADFDQYIDIFMQEVGTNKVIAIRARDLLTPADYLQVQSSQSFAQQALWYSVSPDHTQMAIIYPLYVSVPNAIIPFAVVFINLNDAKTVGPVINPTLNIYAPGKITIQGYNYVGNWPTPTTSANQILGLALNAGTLYIHYQWLPPSGPGGNVTIGTFNSTKPLYSNANIVGIATFSTTQIPTPNAGGGTSPVGNPRFGTMLNPLDGTFLVTWYAGYYHGASHPTYQLFTHVVDTGFNVINSGFTSTPNGDAPLAIIDVSPEYDSHALISGIGGPTGFSPTYLPFDVFASIVSAATFVETISGGPHPTGRSFNKDGFWTGLRKTDNSTPFPRSGSAIIDYVAVLSKDFGKKQIYTITPIDSSVQISPPNPGPVTSQTSFYPAQTAVITGSVYMVDYSDNGVNYCIPKIYKLVKGGFTTIGSVPALTMPSPPPGGSVPIPAVTNISPGWIDPDGIRLFGTSIDGTGLFRYIANQAFTTMEMAPPS